MIKTSTLTPSSLQTPKTSEKEEINLPEFAEPSANCISNILNYSKSLTILESTLVKEIEVVKS